MYTFKESTLKLFCTLLAIMPLVLGPSILHTLLYIDAHHIFVQNTSISALILDAQTPITTNKNYNSNKKNAQAFSFQKLYTSVIYKVNAKYLKYSHYKELEDLNGWKVVKAYCV